MIKKIINVDEQVKSEISPEKTAAIMENLEHAFKRIAPKVECDEDEHTFQLSEIKAGLAVAQAKLALSDKKGKYILEGDITGTPSTLFWILLGAGVAMFFGGGLLFLIFLLILPLFAFLLAPLSTVGLILGVVTFVLYMYNKKLPEVAKSIGDSFVKAVED